MRQTGDDGSNTVDSKLQPTKIIIPNKAVVQLYCSALQPLSIAPDLQSLLGSCFHCLLPQRVLHPDSWGSGSPA